MPPLTIEQVLDLASLHYKAGRLQEAEDLYRQILVQHPEHAETHYRLGLVLKEKGDVEQAIVAFGHAIALNPESAAAFSSLGNALRDQGRFDEAAAACNRAIALKPKSAAAHNNLGNVFRQKGDLNEAIACYRRAIALDPRGAETHNNLGAALMDQGHVNRAIDAYRQAIALKGNFAGAYNNLANAMREAGQLDESVAACRQAIHLDPGYAEAHSNLGNALREQYQLDEALAAHRRAIALNPNYAHAHYNLAITLKDLGRLEEAIASCRTAIQLNPSFAMAHSGLIYMLHFHVRGDPQTIAEEHRRWTRQHVEPILGPLPKPRQDLLSLPSISSAKARNRSPNRRLKIGYVSPDFRSQAECYFVLPLLKAHEHENFEIHCYSSVTKADQITEAMKTASDCWHDVATVSDGELARRVADDEIDILVDLTMHMARHRLLTFARKPAPVQATWLAYPGAAGLASIDYRITDAQMDPPGANLDCYPEAPIHMPDCWVAYSPIDQTPPPNPPPATTSGFITFGSLNNPCKLNDDVIRQWARAMRAAAGSRIIVLALGTHRDHILKTLEEQGVERHRATFVPFRDRKAYLATYHAIDIALDPFPYNGITTTCDALYMGVPVFTLPGDTPASRAGKSLLSAAGLPDLIASNEDDLIERIVALANDLGRLTSLRATLRERVASSALMDAPRFARNLETAYRRMWRKWCEAAPEETAAFPTP